MDSGNTEPPSTAPHHLYPPGFNWAPPQWFYQISKSFPSKSLPKISLLLKGTSLKPSCGWIWRLPPLSPHPPQVLHLTHWLFDLSKQLSLHFYLKPFPTPRKHSSKSLSQPTIPEEGPEHEETSAAQPSFTSKILAAVSGKTATATDRSQAVKTPPTGTKVIDFVKLTIQLLLSSSSLFLSLSSCCFLGVDCLHVLLSLSSLHGGFLCHALRYFSCSCWAPEPRSHPSPRHLSPQSPPTSWKNRVLSEEVRERRAPSWITRPPTPSPLLPSRQSSRGRSPWRRGLFKKSRRSSGAHQGKKASNHSCFFSVIYQAHACRSESRSKKNRDSSLSPKGGSSSFGKDTDLKLEDQKAAKKAESVERSKKTATKETSGDKKDEKKSAVEKRKEFQSHKNPS